MREALVLANARGWEGRETRTEELGDGVRLSVAREEMRADLRGAGE